MKPKGHVNPMPYSREDTDIARRLYNMDAGNYSIGAKATMTQRPGDRTLHHVNAPPQTAKANPARRVQDAMMLDAESRETPALVRYGATAAALALLTGALWPVREHIG